MQQYSEETLITLTKDPDTKSYHRAYETIPLIYTEGANLLGNKGFQVLI